MPRLPLIALPLGTALALSLCLGCRPAQILPATPAFPIADLIHIQKGDLPIVISAPHGGDKEVPGSAPRKGEGLKKGATGFRASRDGGTEELALEVAAELERLTGRKPYVVVASFHRRFVDLNRPAAIAYEDAGGKAAYEAFHGALATASSDVATRFGAGLVVDFHGQGTHKARVYRGTKNGLTVTAMRQKFGEGIHEGPESFLGRLKTLGWDVHPDPGGKEQGGFTGGHVTQTYGAPPFKTDAIQLEFGGDYRRTEADRKKTAATLAKVLAEMAALYQRKP